jgi:predicted metal-dependent peptidase
MAQSNLLSTQERLGKIIAMMFLVPNDGTIKWFGYALSQFDIIASTIIPTAALTVDVYRVVPRIFINPDWAQKLSDGELICILLHELWHFLNQTFARQQLRDPERWNFATDAAINWNIENDIRTMRLDVNKFSLPEGVIHLPPDFQDPAEIYAENIYNKVGENNSGNKSLKDLFSQFMNGDVSLVDDHSLLDGLENIPEEVLKDAIGNVIKNATRFAGLEPGSATRVLEELFKSIVPWTTLLRFFEGQHIKIGRKPSWMRSNRRFPGIQPGNQIKRGGKLAILIDVSGSTSGDMPRFWGEAYELSKRHETWVVECDAQVCGKPRKLNIHSPPEVHGGGGTDMNPGLAMCKKLKADMIIVLTDGYLFNTPIDTGIPELWVICKSGQLVANKRCIQIND